MITLKRGTKMCVIDLKRKIVTTYWPKPGPDRQFDWSATQTDHEPPMPIGYGRTEDEAIEDLKSLLDD